LSYTAANAISGGHSPALPWGVRVQEQGRESFGLPEGEDECLLQGHKRGEVEDRIPRWDYEHVPVYRNGPRSQEVMGRAVRGDHGPGMIPSSGQHPGWSTKAYLARMGFRSARAQEKEQLEKVGPLGDRRGRDTSWLRRACPGSTFGARRSPTGARSPPTSHVRAPTSHPRSTGPASRVEQNITR
jgi:hypothetical protein